MFSTVAPGNDPVVVNAERVATLSFVTVDGFTEWEHYNRASVPKAVTDAADTLRDDFPHAYTSFRDATKAYKFNRDANNKATLNTALAVIQQLLNTANTYLPPAERTRVQAKAAAMLNPPELSSFSVPK